MRYDYYWLLARHSSRGEFVRWTSKKQVRGLPGRRARTRARSRRCCADALVEIACVRAAAICPVLPQRRPLADAQLPFFCGFLVCVWLGFFSCVVLVVG